MIRKQIDQSREIRLWIRDIIIPAVTTVGAFMIMNPEARKKVADKAKDTKDWIVQKFKKEEES